MNLINYYFCLFSCLCIIFLQSISSYAFETNFGIIKKMPLNVRKGPSKEYPIFFTINDSFPLKILHKIEDWCLVEEHMNRQGWITCNQIRKIKNSVILKEEAILYRLPYNTKQKIGSLSKGSIMRLKICGKIYCRIINMNNSKISGWINKKHFW